MTQENTDSETGLQTASNDSATVLEQWKFYGQTTQEVSNRRLKNNRFYLRLLIALLGVAGIGARLGYLAPLGLIAIGGLGIVFCVLWAFHILSYKQLNGGKYRVLKEMADELPFAPFDREWECLDAGDTPEVYIEHTTVEVWWPRVLGYFYGTVTVYGVLAALDALAYLWIALTVLTLGWTLYAVSVLRGKSPSQQYWDYTGD